MHKCKQFEHAYSPKISILTPSYNQGNYLEENILSILNQNYKNVEHIIIDGGSTDNTITVLKKYPHLKWVSEKDGGQADALNKGLALATGDIIGWINSDDYYLNNIFLTVVNLFANKNVQWIVGNTLSCSEFGTQRTENHVEKITVESLLKNPDIVKQQGAFYRREAIAQVGGWNANLFMVMDYDLWIRLSSFSKPLMLPKPLGCFRVTQNQKTSLRNARRQLQEIDNILKLHRASFINRVRVRLNKELCICIMHLKLLYSKLMRFTE